MTASSRDASPSSIPGAPLSDLDLSCDADEQAWELRVMALAADRLGAARARLERLGIIDADGALVSTTLPFDMTTGSRGTPPATPPGG